MQYVSPTKLRCYFFGNMYISQIAHGIQAAHVVTKLFARYGRRYEGNDGAAGDMLFDWADNGVTKILLNGGYQSNLADVYAVFEYICPVLDLPCAKFHEEEAALNGALTSVGVVVPEEIYNADMTYWTGTLTSRLYDTKTPQDVLTLLRDRIKPPCEVSEGAMEQYRGLLVALLNITLKSARLA